MYHFLTQCPRRLALYLRVHPGCRVEGASLGVKWRAGTRGGGGEGLGGAVTQFLRQLQGRRAQGGVGGGLGRFAGMRFLRKL